MSDKTIKELKALSKEEFIKETNCPELVYDSLQKSKEGFIEIEKISPTSGEPHKGYTQAFGEGLSCYLSNISRWYVTSVIQKIDWDKKEFTTLNSVYKFNFKEVNDETKSEQKPS